MVMVVGIFSVEKSKNVSKCKVTERHTLATANKGRRRSGYSKRKCPLQADDQCDRLYPVEWLGKESLTHTPDPIYTE